MRQHLSHDRLAQLILRNLQLVRRLEVQPELGCGTEVARQAQRGIRCDAAFLIDDVVDASSGNAERERQLMRRDGQRDEKLLAENFSGVDCLRSRLCVDSEPRP